MKLDCFDKNFGLKLLKKQGRAKKLVLKFSEAAAVSALDVINTTTPPGFELYFWSEFTRLSNLGRVNTK